MNPATFVAVFVCCVAAAFDARVAVLLACGLGWLVSGHDPLWLIEHGAGWLRTSLIRLACIAAWRVLEQFAGAKELVVEE